MANFDVNNKLSLPELSFYNWHNQVIRQIMGNTSSMVDAMRVYQRELYNRFGLSLELSTPDGHIKITVNGRDTYFPDTPRNLPLFLLFSVIGYQRWMQAKYTSEGVDVDSNDIVIDCGSFGGGFSKYALSRGAKVYAIEPSQSNREIIANNVTHPNLKVLPIGLGDKDEVLQFNESDSGPDSSFLKPDDGNISKQYDVQIHRIETLVNSGKIEKPTFIKVEAEGFEEKVLEGFGAVNIDKVVIDGSDEGEKVGNKENLSRQLEQMGYDVRTEVNMLFARSTKAN